DRPASKIREGYRMHLPIFCSATSAKERLTCRNQPMLPPSGPKSSRDAGPRVRRNAAPSRVWGYRDRAKFGAYALIRRRQTQGAFGIRATSGRDHSKLNPELVQASAALKFHSLNSANTIV